MQYDSSYFHGGRYDSYRDYPSNWDLYDVIKELKPKSVLEIGCARGYLLKRLKDSGIVTAGLEISHHCKLTKVTDFDEGDCRQPWPYKDQQFDLCFSNQLMECFNQKERFFIIDESQRVAKNQLHLEVEHYNHAKNIPQGDNNLKLNLGSYINMFHYGWLNMDILNLEEYAKDNCYKFQQCDCRNKLPFNDNSVDLIYSSHFFEHIEYGYGLNLLNELRRIMKNGGICRLLVPDAKKLIDDYNNNKLCKLQELTDASYFEWGEAAKLYGFLSSGEHKAFYDYDTLKTMALLSGLKINRRAFLVGNDQILKETIDMLPDISLIVELTKINELPIEFKNVEFRVTDKDMTAQQFRECLWFYNSEKEIRNAWWDIRPDDVIIDVGSAVGSWTLPALAKGATVLAVEPCLFFSNRLKTQIELNHFDKFYFSNYLLGNNNTMRYDYYPSSHSFRAEGAAEERGQITLDTLVNDYKLNKVDWIKIDTEGSEFEILQGAKDTLTKWHPTIILEYHEQFISGVSDRCRKFLKGLGYTEEPWSDAAYSRWTHTAPANRFTTPYVTVTLN